MQSIYYMSEQENKKFPMFLSYDIRKELRELCDKNIIRSFLPSVWIGRDKKLNRHGICWIYINEEEGLFVTSGMRAQNFPISESELLEEIMIFDLYEKLKSYLKGNIEASSNKEISSKINEFEVRYTMSLVISGGCRKG
ncbi:hypothetical protein HMSSN036_87150 [Paenibacillus macerans]|nr:hypothetical protein HMSSN036_87150 [Paenibacillus macerans]